MANASQRGFWLLIHDRELFVSSKQFPWFRDVSIGALCNVELPHPRHLHWPDLDIDLAVESLEHPRRFPLVSRVRPKNALQPPRAAGPTGKRVASRRGPRG